MNHEPFLKLTSQERKNGRMVDVESVCVCRCGKRFPSAGQLKAHIYEPFSPTQENPQATSPQLSAFAS